MANEMTDPIATLLMRAFHKGSLTWSECEPAALEAALNAAGAL